MGLLSRLVSGSLYAATPSPTDDFWYQPVNSGAMTAAGMRVDPETAQKISAWYRGRDILATVLAMLPLPVYERLPNDGGADIARGHPLYDILHDKPGEGDDSFQWRREKMYNIIDHGWTYDWIRSGTRGFVDKLEPIHPTLVTPRRIKSGQYRGRWLFDVRDEQTGQTSTHTQDEIFYLRGAQGKGILEYARTSLGTALATESYAAKIYSRGTLSGGVIENPGVLDAEASRRMALSFVTAAGDWHLPKVLEQGSKFVRDKMTPEDAQMLLSRKFSIDDMARWLGVPRMMLENSDPSFGNAEQFDQNFITYTMGPWLSLFEFGINTQLILNPRRFYAQFTRQAIVRGDLGTRAEAQVKYVNAGIMTRDEVRKQEDLNTRGGQADELLIPQNITGKPTAEKPPEEPTPAREDSAKASAIVQESAARVLRKEIAAVQKMAVRYAADADAFAAAVTDFYSTHAELVEQTLQMTRAEADGYCAGQASQVLTNWVAALELWRAPDYAAGLAGLALEDAA